ncbi:MAG TPA: hypothetical protein VJV04_15750 [Nitrospiraceae bacterium]|nr:hypothetical protein [Nitrospiraceae bacterium]
MDGTILHKTSPVVFVACLLLTACALFQSWQTIYLKKAVNHATKEEVIQRMGAPQGSRDIDTGGSLLLYRVKEFQAGDLNGPGRWWCDDYHLQFDQEEILRQWSKNDCSRSYNFPAY